MSLSREPSGKPPARPAPVRLGPQPAGPRGQDRTRSCEHALQLWGVRGPVTPGAGDRDRRIPRRWLTAPQHSHPPEPTPAALGGPGTPRPTGRTPAERTGPLQVRNTQAWADGDPAAEGRTFKTHPSPSSDDRCGWPAETGRGEGKRTVTPSSTDTERPLRKEPPRGTHGKRNGKLPG